MTFDVLLTGGIVVDGTGVPPFRAEVGIDGAVLRVVRGDIGQVTAARTINVAGKVIAPGFIDVHSHSDLAVFGAPLHELKLLQGVTTELVGADGLSYAPFADQASLHDHARMNVGIGGDLPRHHPWRSVAEYLDALDGATSTNVACLVGNSALRQTILGWTDRAAAPDETAAMARLLRQSLDEGAVGLSSGLDYPPGSAATTDELVALAAVVGERAGIYHTHIRYALGDHFLDPVSEALDIGRRSGARVHVTHLTHRLGRPERPEAAMGLIGAARRDGVDATFDTLIVREGQTRALIVLPHWTQAQGPARLLSFLQDPDARAQLRMEVRPRSPSWSLTWLTNLRRPENAEFDGLSVEEIALRRGQHPCDALCDLLIAEDLGVGMVFDGVDEADVSTWLSEPTAIVSSDGILAGPHGSPRSASTFPRLLSRARTQDHRLEDLVRRVTGLPADLLGLPDRGRITDGAAADLVVFDPHTVQSTADRANPTRPPTGVSDVFVNGRQAVEAGLPTGVLAGRALRGAG